MVLVEVPCGFVTSRVTSNLPGVLYVIVGFVAVDVPVFAPSNVQLRLEIVPL
jgi:hypothetical protein